MSGLKTSSAKSRRRWKHRRPRQLSPHPTIDGALRLPLTRGFVATIDVDDVAVVGSVPWCVAGRLRRMYAVGRPLGHARTVQLHRFLWSHWGLPVAEQLDHINGDQFDNRRQNLRAATSAENGRNKRMHRDNRTGLKGVTPVRGKYKAQIYVNYKVKNLGLFPTPELAHAAYVAAAREHFGEFARTA